MKDLDPGGGTEALPCGEWFGGGTGPTFTWEIWSESRIEIELTVTRGSETAVWRRSLMAW